MMLFHVWQANRPFPRRVCLFLRRGGFLCMARTASEFLGAPDAIVHWIPGEIVVVIRLKRKPAEETQETLIEQIRATLNTWLAPYAITLEAYGTAGRWHETTSMP